MEEALEKANRYIKEHSHEVKTRYRQLFHALPPLGWCNDPNGFCQYHGKFHLFFQFNPYETRWGPMHWGHLTSDDLLHYEECLIALAPSDYESGGCFSGTAIINPFGKDELLLYYTSHNEENGLIRQETSLAISEDGIHFSKKGKVITEEMIPLIYSRTDFRDPKAYYEDGYLYLIMASHDKDEKGCLLIYRGTSIDKFSFHMSLSLEEMGIQSECPDLVKIDDKYLLIFCSIHKGRKSTSSYAVLDLDLGKKSYKKLSCGPLDYGHDFYAPQMTSFNGKVYLTAWLESWKNEYDFQKMNEGYVGSFSLPREITLLGNRLIQKPLPAFYDYLGDGINEGPIAESGLLIFSLEKGQSLILDKDDEKSRVSIKRENDSLTISLYSDSEKVEKDIPYEGEEISLIIDKASIELYLPNGLFASFAHYFLQEDIEVDGPSYLFRPYIG